MFWNRKKREQDLERELRTHLELEAEEQRENYADSRDAANAARRALGNTTLIREATREAWGLAWLDRFAKDLRYGARSLRRSPTFAVLAILTAALGIGANTSIFSVVDAVLLHPLPYPHAERLVSPYNATKSDVMGMGAPDFQYARWRDQPGVWDGIAAYSSRRLTLTGMGDPEQLRADEVTPGFLRTLQVTPLIGRDFSAADADPRGGHVALIGYGLWQRRFGGDPGILSRTMTLDGELYTIAGVLRREFEFPENIGADVLVALREPDPIEPARAAHVVGGVIARLKPNVTLARAEAEMAVIDRRAKVWHFATRIVPLHDRLVGDVRPALLVLSGAVALVLLIVCVNISNLLLARAIARQKEMAVRIALGAGRGRVARQLLTEGILLAGVGGIGGLVLAFGGVALLRAISPADVPHIANAHINGAVLAFNLALAIASGILFGLAPLRGVSGIDPEAALKLTARSTTGARGHRRLENLLILAETAFALILLAGAGLLIRTFVGLTSIAPGFQPDNILTAKISLPYWKYSEPLRQREFWDHLMESARTHGTRAVGAVACLPYGGFVMMNWLEIEGKAAHEAGSAAIGYWGVVVNPVAGDYFRALKIPVLEGRSLDSGDRDGRPPVVVINETLRRRFFPNGSALGARIKVRPFFTDWPEIVGVVGDVKQTGLASEPRPEIFAPAAQFDDGIVQTLAIRTAGDARQFIPWLRAQIAAADKDLPPPEIETMRDKMASLVASQLFVMRLLALFAGIAITLAAMGIYSVLVYSVERRTHEIGIRLALGARPFAIMSLVMRRGLWLAICGSAIGIAGGLLLTRYLKSLLYGVTPHDPLTMAVGSLVVVLVALIAAYFPARRAVRQDPIATLRSE